jgi:hypothetical protein
MPIQALMTILRSSMPASGWIIFFFAGCFSALHQSG